MSSKGLLHRRHIRIKVLQSFYAYEMEENASAGDAVRGLFESIDDIYDLYLLMMSSFAELYTAAENKKEIILRKRFKEENEEKAFDAFLESPILKSIVENEFLKSAREAYKVSWNEDDSDMFGRIFMLLAESKLYEDYRSKNATLTEDLQFACNLFRDFVVNDEALQETLEEKCISWPDDLDLVAITVLKTIDSFDTSNYEKNKLVRLYKDKEDDLDFAKKLLQSALRNRNEITDLVQGLSKNWEWPRIAKMDRMILRLGFAEAMNFPNIPIKVTINEYVDLAKEYSTEDSATFVNGILDKGIKQLTTEGTIAKQGRGLIG
jgi:N utilization substance protein B